MKERGIGRPSTYAKIVKTLLDRKYVKEVKRFLFSTKIGFIVYNFLIKHYKNYVSEELTRKLEEQMDRIEEGKIDYKDVLEKIYSEVLEIIKQ